jgi:hypothetical protein
MNWGNCCGISQKSTNGVVPLLQDVGTALIHAWSSVEDLEIESKMLSVN